MPQYTDFESFKNIVRQAAANGKVLKINSEGDIETGVDTGGMTEAEAQELVDTHSTDTTSVHGITNTATLATQTYVSDAVDTHELTPHGGTETWEEAMTLAATGMVHRWKFEETSGTSVNDEVGTNDGTLNGSYTQGVTSPIGNCVRFTGGYMSAAIGNAPLSDNTRTILWVFRSTDVSPLDGARSLGGWGTSAGTRTTWEAACNEGTSSRFSIHVLGGDAMDAGNRNFLDAQWHLVAIRYHGSRSVSWFIDGIDRIYWTVGGALATATSNINVARSPRGVAVANPLEVADCAIWNRAVSDTELQRLHTALVSTLT